MTDIIRIKYSNDKEIIHETDDLMSELVIISSDKNIKDAYLNNKQIKRNYVMLDTIDIGVNYGI